MRIIPVTPFWILRRRLGWVAGARTMRRELPRALLAGFADAIAEQKTNRASADRTFFT
ncbi:MAG TPA: hypothetical protein VFF17_10565 [Thermoanaerobaculia bacterium]|nr:hypothetical protein [Thermoanaerobaculia bacterium]